MQSTSIKKPDVTSTGENRRQEMAPFGSPVKENELAGDDGLFRALVSGCHIENAAVAAGISERTAYRRLADPVFRKQIDDARQSLRESILSRLSDAGHDAIGVVSELMYESEDEHIRLKAAKVLLDALLLTQRSEPKAKASATNLNANVGTLAISINSTESPALAANLRATEPSHD